VLSEACKNDLSAPVGPSSHDEICEIVSVEEGGGRCTIKWGENEQETFPTGDEGKFYLRRAVAVQHNHGLGDAMVTAPILSLQDGPVPDTGITLS
jgi:hypothetical protein